MNQVIQLNPHPMTRLPFRLVHNIVRVLIAKRKINWEITHQGTLLKAHILSQSPQPLVIEVRNVIRRNHPKRGWYSTRLQKTHLQNRKIVGHFHNENPSRCQQFSHCLQDIQWLQDMLQNVVHQDELILLRIRPQLVHQFIQITH